jgi:hypothetical protein
MSMEKANTNITRMSASSPLLDSSSKQITNRTIVSEARARITHGRILDTRRLPSIRGLRVAGD